MLRARGFGFDGGDEKLELRTQALGGSVGAGSRGGRLGFEAFGVGGLQHLLHARRALEQWIEGVDSVIGI